MKLGTGGQYWEFIDGKYFLNKCNGPLILRALIDKVMFILHSEHAFDITDTVSTESGLPYETSHTGTGKYNANVIIYWNKENSGKSEPTVIHHQLGFGR